MKKFYIGFLAVSILFLAAWSDYRPAINRPKSVVIDASSTVVPTAFSNAAGSLVMQDLGDKYFQHIMVLNETKSPISVLTIPEVSAAPAATVTNQRLHVASSGAAAFDDISVFDNLYIQSEDNQIGADKVKIMLW